MTNFIIVLLRKTTISLFCFSWFRSFKRALKKLLLSSNETDSFGLLAMISYSRSQTSITILWFDFCSSAEQIVLLKNYLNHSSLHFLSATPTNHDKVYKFTLHFMFCSITNFNCTATQWRDLMAKGRKGGLIKGFKNNKNITIKHSREHLWNMFEKLLSESLLMEYCELIKFILQHFPDKLIRKALAKLELNKTQ